MGKRVLVILTSLRAGSNSDRLGEAFAKGAEEAGNQVETVSLKGKQLRFCLGCLSCIKTQKCVIRDDDAPEIVAKMKEADVIAFATPVYYYGMSGQMKVLLDRANPLYTADYAFRDIYLLATAAEDEDEAVDGTRNGVECWIACFEKARLAGTVFAGGVDGPGTVEGHPAVLKAYETGKAV